MDTLRQKRNGAGVDWEAVGYNIGQSLKVAAHITIFVIFLHFAWKFW